MQKIIKLIWETSKVPPPPTPMVAKIINNQNDYWILLFANHRYWRLNWPQNRYVSLQSYYPPTISGWATKFGLFGVKHRLTATDIYNLLQTLSGFIFIWKSKWHSRWWAMELLMLHYQWSLIDLLCFNCQVTTLEATMYSWGSWSAF